MYKECTRAIYRPTYPIPDTTLYMELMQRKQTAANDAQQSERLLRGDSTTLYTNQRDVFQFLLLLLTMYRSFRPFVCSQGQDILRAPQ